jgi:His-Xaa-Ser repeat protein HxsA
MNLKRFLISTLSLAGLGAADATQAQFIDAVSRGGGDDPNKGTLFKRFSLDHKFILAGHSSHSSHSSHASHSSGSGGGYAAPAYEPSPVYRPAPLYTPPVVATPAPRVLSGRTELFTSIVRRVQLGLQAYGYYKGVSDGVVGDATRDALRRFQTDFKLHVTGTITPEVLDALRITAE